MDLLTALLLVSVGAFLGGAVQTAVSRYAAFKESKGIAKALKAEIGSLLSLIEEREYVNILDQIIGRLQNPAYAPDPEETFSVPVTQDYFGVFSALTSKIGLLADLSARLREVAPAYLAALDEAIRVGTNEAFRRLGSYRGLYTQIRRFPEWPFRIKTIASFVSVVVIPLFVSIASQAIGSVLSK